MAQRRTRRAKSCPADAEHLLPAALTRDGAAGLRDEFECFLLSLTEWLNRRIEDNESDRELEKLTRSETQHLRAMAGSASRCLTLLRAR